jgi:hypothetical protein
LSSIESPSVLFVFVIWNLFPYVTKQTLGCGVKFSWLYG